MRILALCLVFSMPLLSLADCGCGAKCAMYTGAVKCTRCCTTTVKRSLDATLARRSHRFLLPSPSHEIRLPMWLQPAATLRKATPPPPVKHHRRHRRPVRRCILDQILEAALERRRDIS
ncbi:hypothetical protein Y032_0378g296 [Ancylostoma ceylanicum]|uniref:Secreted protein n=1 Tax=Ancylostoma ceylanicum TaxID=53326 RepID=A0A016RTK9_9BILA|nr:hypothetical protein Y032_0378g296 [Ancylostoma ceylanicum]